MAPLRPCGRPRLRCDGAAPARRSERRVRGRDLPAGLLQPGRRAGLGRRRVSGRGDAGPAEPHHRRRPRGPFAGDGRAPRDRGRAAAGRRIRAASERRLRGPVRRRSSIAGAAPACRDRPGRCALRLRDTRPAGPFGRRREPAGPSRFDDGPGPSPLAPATRDLPARELAGPALYVRPSRRRRLRYVSHRLRPCRLARPRRTPRALLPLGEPAALGRAPASRSGEPIRPPDIDLGLLSDRRDLERLASGIGCSATSWSRPP